MAGWLNHGLYTKYGVEQTVPMAGGEYVTTGALREVEFKILLTSLGSSSAIATSSTYSVDNIFIPSGVRIEEVEIVVDTAATSGGSAALNIGLVDTDRSTAIDADGLVAALALTSIDAAGEKTVLRPGSTSAGALIGTTTADVGYIVADYDTAAYTAGTITVRVRYRKV